MTREPIRVLRVIARLNIGGPAIQAINLTALMQSRGYATRLVRGSESAAKGGTLGRVAVMLAFPRRRPKVVHTFHGHSLTGYFSSRTARMYTRIERFLARRTDVL